MPCLKHISENSELAEAAPHLAFFFREQFLRTRMTILTEMDLIGKAL
jgi:hypothetical protein